MKSPQTQLAASLASLLYLPSLAAVAGGGRQLQPRGLRRGVLAGEAGDGGAARAESPRAEGRGRGDDRF